MPRSAMSICTAGLGICIPVQIRKTELKLQYYSKGLDRTATYYKCSVYVILAISQSSHGRAQLSSGDIYLVFHLSRHLLPAIVYLVANSESACKSAWLYLPELLNKSA